MSNSPYYQEIHTVAHVPKLIWAYWDSDSVPTFIQRLTHSWKVLNPDHSVTLITPKTLASYLSIPTPEHFEDCISAHRSDWLRLAILDQHGGIWLDASTIVTAPLNFLHTLQQEKRSSGVAFHMDKFTHDIRYPVIETGMLVSLPNSEFIHSWFTEYNKVFVEHGGTDTYLTALQETYGKERYEKMVQGIDSPSYLKLNMALQKIMQVDNVKGIFSLAAESEPYGTYQIQKRDNWVWEIAVMRLLGASSRKVPPLIKLRGFERAFLEKFTAFYYWKSYDSVYYKYVIGI